jgi:flagellar motility protein MotE (MotC chaperone)
MVARPPRQAAAIGGVALIAFCFAASALLRLGDFGMALAQDAVGALPAGVAGCEPADPDGLLAAIRTREAQLAAEADRIAERQQTLHVAETKLAEQLASFEAARAGLEATLALAEDAAENDIARLTTVYERMKPEEAARILGRMDIAFASGLVARMKPEIAAEVLTRMESDSAYAITLTIASRHARVPVE